MNQAIEKQNRLKTFYKRGFWLCFTYFLIDILL